MLPRSFAFQHRQIAWHSRCTDGIRTTRTGCSNGEEVLMHRRLLMTIAVFLTFYVSAATASAQSENWMIGVFGAAAPVAGITRNHLKRGWNVDFGAERKITSSGIGLRGDFNYYGLGVSDQVLRTLQVP